MSVLVPYAAVKDVKEILSQLQAPDGVGWDMCTQKETIYEQGQWKGYYHHRGLQFRWKSHFGSPYPLTTTRKLFGPAYHFLTHGRAYKDPNGYRYAAYYKSTQLQDQDMWKAEIQAMDNLDMTMRLWPNVMRDPLDQRGNGFPDKMNNYVVTLPLVGYHIE